jgi:predicted NAD/FAD-dependent oxidoreductase
MSDVAIVGAGLAGLCCAARLEQAGVSVTLLEAADAPGGRIRTDYVDGCRLDRGFQILFTGYPELAYHIDMRALRLRRFSRGALVRHGGRFHYFADPFRGSIGNALGIITDPVISFGDKIRIARLRRHVGHREPEEIFRGPEVTTRQFLERYGFTPKIMERLFGPMCSGLFLEQELATSSRYFQFMFRMLAFGDAVVPENGMEALPRQLAVRLRKGSVHTGIRVTALRRDGRSFVLETANGLRYGAEQVVIAVDASQANTLIGNLGLASSPIIWNRATAFYYTAHRSPIDGPLIALNGEGSAAGPVNSAVVISQASERHAPPGMHLIAANVVGRAPQSAAQIEQLERETRAQLQRWFGGDVARWTICAGYPTVQAVPLCTHAEWQSTRPRLAEGLYLCGDHRDLPLIQGALASGRRAAESVLRHCS